MVCKGWGALLTLSVFAFLEEKMSQLCCGPPKSALAEASSALQQKKAFRLGRLPTCLLGQCLNFFCEALLLLCSSTKTKRFALFPVKTTLESNKIAQHACRQQNFGLYRSPKSVSRKKIFENVSWGF